MVIIDIYKNKILLYREHFKSYDDAQLWLNDNKENIKDCDGIHIMNPSENLTFSIDFTEDIKFDFKWAYIRSKRNQIIAASDWTQLVDSPLNSEQKQRWRKYRQALRDVPQKVYDIAEHIVVWPKSPAEEDAEARKLRGE